MLQEKIDELEQEREKNQTKIAEEKRLVELKLRDGFAKLMEQKEIEVEKLNRELKKTREFLN